jgi:hypothetical protein
MINYQVIPTIFTACRKSSKSMIEFEKALAKLKGVINKDLSKNKEVQELIIWWRKEHEKRPEVYSGDHIVLAEIYNNVLKGVSLEKAISLTKIALEFKFTLLDYTRRSKY